jgi:hypothetical protein
MTRRAALVAVGAALAVLKGRVLAAPPDPAGQSPVARQIMLLVLDGVDDIVVQHRGRRVAVKPQDILDALSAKG